MTPCKQHPPRKACIFFIGREQSALLLVGCNRTTKVSAGRINTTKHDYLALIFYLHRLYRQGIRRCLVNFFLPNPETSISPDTDRQHRNQNTILSGGKAFEKGCRALQNGGYS